MSSSGRAIGRPGRRCKAPAPRVRLRVCAALWVVAAGACSLLPVEGGLGDCSGALLSSQDEVGAQCIERMVQEGGAIASWIEREGKPDYFEVVGKRVRLIYIERDQVVELARSASGTVGARTSTPIRASDHTRFRNDDRVRLGQARVNRVPAAPSAVADRPNQVMRARVGERADEAESESEPTAPDEPK